jgi:hypothetical protein
VDEMHKSKYSLLRSINFRKALSWYVLTLLFLSIFAGLMINVTAAENDVLKTYRFEGFLNETTDFSDGDQVIVNITVDSISGDPDPFFYNITALNNNTGEWVNVPVSDNDTSFPWEDNTAGDGEYWGCFNLSNTEPTQNYTGPGTFSILHISNEDTVNISEDPFSMLDGDLEIGYILIDIVDGGGPPPGDDNGTGTIRGFVNDSKGGSIEGATVLINRTDQGQPVEFMQTNETGEYIFNDNVTEGTYDVEVWKEGYVGHVVNNVSVLENETSWVNFTMGAPDGGEIEFDQWLSSLDQTYIMNNTEETFNFSIRSWGGGTIDNLTIAFPEGFTYQEPNGTTVTDLNYRVYNTENSVVWQKTNEDGFLLNNNENFWFNASSNASLGAGQFNFTIYVDGNETDEPLRFTVFTTTTFYHTGSIFDMDGQPLEGAEANISAQSFSMDGPVEIGYFCALSNESGVYNITDIPTTVENANNLDDPGFMGPGGMDEDQIFYQLSAADYSSVYPNLATHVSTSLPYVPIMEFINLLGEPEIYLKPAISFRVNVTGPIYTWNHDNETMNVTDGPKEFSIMVKDQRLGFQVKEFNTRTYERTFSVPQDRDYSFTIFANQSFPISVNFSNILTTCQGSQDFGLTGVTTEFMLYNDTYLINVSVDVSFTNQWLSGTFNNVTDPLEMKVVVYNMEHQGDEMMVFENWAMPYNLDDDFKNGTLDQYNLGTNEYNIALPATNASSYLLLRAYARNATGYYMGSAKIIAENQTLNPDSFDFDMEQLIEGEYSVNRTITSNNVSNNWTETTVVETIGVLFNLVNNGTVLENENPFVEMKRELNGEIYNQMVDGSNGQFNVSLVEGEGLYKLTIYSQQYAPISTSVSADVISGAESTDTISCEDGQCNITMREFGEYDPLGKNATIMMMMYKSNDTCNVPNPPDICDLCASDEGDEPLDKDANKSGEMSKDEFSPFAAILKGDISMMIKSNTSNGTIYVYYLTVDLLASGPPDASFSTDAVDADDGLAKAWQFGSQGPEIYEEVLIGIPLDDELINKTVKVTIPLLYDNDLTTVLWNASAGDTVDTILNDSTLYTLYGDYLDSEYEAYLNGTGVICNESDPTLSSGLGYKDVDNRTVWIKIPHFSGVGPEVTGEEPDPPSSFAAESDSDTEISLTWVKGGKADYTYIERNETNQTIWARGEGIEIYNGTGTSFDDTNLSEDVTYYYRAWSLNVTNGYWSVTNSSTSRTTGEDAGGGGSGGGSGGGGGGDDTPQNETDDETDDTTTTTSNDTINDINDNYNLNLQDAFYATDTDDDGEVDSFTDPNSQLTAITSTEIGNNTAFLISTDDDEVPEFFWDADTDTVTDITHAPGTALSEDIDDVDETITVTIEVNKSDNWIYIEIADDYPDFELTVETDDGRIISSDKIWRENGKIYVLDDPDTEYEFIYAYTLLEPTFDPQTGTEFTTQNPTITITYSEMVTIESATWDDNAVTLETTDNLVFTYSPEDLANGAYTLSVTAKDDEENTRTDVASYTVNVESDDDTDGDGVPWYWWIIIIVAIIWIIIGIMFKTGFLYIEHD